MTALGILLWFARIGQRDGTVLYLPPCGLLYRDKHQCKYLVMLLQYEVTFSTLKDGMRPAGRCSDIGSCSTH